MELREISLEELDRFAGSQPNSQLLQSAGWSKFQKSVGRQTWSLGVFWDDELKATASVIGHRLPLSKSYLYCPRGPVFENKLAEEEKTEALKLILSKARDLTIRTKSSEEIFFRLEPAEKINLPLCPTRGIQPPTTLLLGLEP
ncbi:MAG TPA: peptidoglycan bridge formation glycyltransferase FemA/FemB family protein, partial [Patescibacteria group bacterium]|nr:peptidoglycan bridge formation glycyltransferase FemA/FemB family protein [Patescibacteria group bacterium]